MEDNLWWRLGQPGCHNSLPNIDRISHRSVSLLPIRLRMEAESWLLRNFRTLEYVFSLILTNNAYVLETWLEQLTTRPFLDREQEVSPCLESIVTGQRSASLLAQQTWQGEWTVITHVMPACLVQVKSVFYRIVYY